MAALESARARALNKKQELNINQWISVEETAIFGLLTLIREVRAYRRIFRWRLYHIKRVIHACKVVFPAGAECSSVRHEGDFEQNGGRSLPPFHTRALVSLFQRRPEERHRFRLHRIMGIKKIHTVGE